MWKFVNKSHSTRKFRPAHNWRTNTLTIWWFGLFFLWANHPPTYHPKGILTKKKKPKQTKTTRKALLTELEHIQFDLRFLRNFHHQSCRCCRWMPTGNRGNQWINPADVVLFFLHCVLQSENKKRDTKVMKSVMNINKLCSN
jgi:hypothetical protein